LIIRDEHKIVLSCLWKIKLANFALTDIAFKTFITLEKLNLWFNFLITKEKSMLATDPQSYFKGITMAVDYLIN
jgi:hypothetical protein